MEKPHLWGLVAQKEVASVDLDGASEKFLLGGERRREDREEEEAEKRENRADMRASLSSQWSRVGQILRTRFAKTHSREKLR